jgi:D-apionolactonase
MDTATRNRMLHGIEADPPRTILLRAGPVQVRYQCGELRYVSLHGREVIRRIYIAVRDRDWRTLPSTIHRELVRRDEKSFEISYEAKMVTTNLALFGK